MGHVRERAKSATLTLLDAGGFRLARRLSRRRPLVLTYHPRIPDSVPSGKRPENIILASEFEEQIAHIVRHHHVVSGAELRAHVCRGTTLPPNSVLLTFDDGYLNNYQYAFPILRRYGVPATFFLTA